MIWKEELDKIVTKAYDRLIESMGSGRCYYLPSGSLVWLPGKRDIFIVGKERAFKMNRGFWRPDEMWPNVREFWRPNKPL